MTGELAGAISGGLTVASMIVRMVHDMVRDAISDVIGKLASKVAWTAGGFSDSACFVLQAAFFRPRKSLSASSGVRYPRAE